MLQILIFLIFTAPLIYRFGLALVDPKALKDYESNQLRQRLEAIFGPMREDPLLNRVGKRLIESTKQDAKISIIHAPLVNAIALPDGEIIVWSGLFNQIRASEDQIASVLAHELAHVMHDHHLRRLYWLALLHFVVAYVGRGWLNPILGNISMRWLFAGFSRFQERQADDTAIQILSDAGYRPEAAIELLQRMEDHPAGFFASHPPPAQRIERLKKKLGIEEEPPTSQVLHLENHSKDKERISQNKDESQKKDEALYKDDVEKPDEASAEIIPFPSSPF
ncbi:MAG: hypothetical protein CMK59_12495 [Proteobacteria bacterium]|nr:hypothetical protein [Pseudomonadota bacterium]